MRWYWAEVQLLKNLGPKIHKCFGSVLACGPESLKLIQSGLKDNLVHMALEASNVKTLRRDSSLS